MGVYVIPENDPLGAAVSEYLQGKALPYIEVDTNMTENEVMGTEYLFRDFESMPEPEKIALKNCYGAVLDVGAGAGVHGIYLQEQQIDVTCLDRSKACCDVMTERGINNVLQEDIFDFVTDQQYDCILLLMNGSGIAGTIDNFRVLLKKLTRLLKKGGSIFMESADIRYMYEDEDGSFLLPLDYYYGEMQYRMKYRDYDSGYFDWLFVDPDVLDSICDELALELQFLYSGEEFEYLARIKKR